MLRVTQIRIPVEETQQDIRTAVADRLSISPDDIDEIQIERRAIDARKKPHLYFVYTVLVQSRQERLLLRKRRKGVQAVTRHPYRFPVDAPAFLTSPPVIIGSGPAGLFCARMLARYGFRPILLERGGPVEDRVQQVARFWQEGILHPESNVQFGEGGAGTFSDGKLYSGVHDPVGRKAMVMRLFQEAGAPEEVLYDAHAHLGTDKLRDIVRTLREQICSDGGEIRFYTKVVDFQVLNNRLQALCLEDGSVLPVSAAVLAIGHAARDTFQILWERQIPMEPKSFAIGLRVQHPQALITRIQYGVQAPSQLGPASYRLGMFTKTGQPVYSFCMCPGGYIVNASSEAERLVVNGMSESARDSGFANSAIVTAISTADCAALICSEQDSLFSGLILQKTLEKKAYLLGEGAIPIQHLGAFQAHQKEDRREEYPGFCGQTQQADLSTLLPEPITAAFLAGMEEFGKRIPCFDDPNVLLAGVESRTSSPIRILRDDTLQSPVRGLYPCGEGAGYAGGITSAAMDGIAVAESVARQLQGTYTSC